MCCFTFFFFLTWEDYREVWFSDTTSDLHSCNLIPYLLYFANQRHRGCPAVGNAVSSSAVLQLLKKAVIPVRISVSVAPTYCDHGWEGRILPSLHANAAVVLLYIMRLCRLSLIYWPITRKLSLEYFYWEFSNIDGCSKLFAVLCSASGSNWERWWGRLGLAAVTLQQVCWLFAGQLLCLRGALRKAKWFSNEDELWLGEKKLLFINKLKKKKQ